MTIPSSSRRMMVLTSRGTDTFDLVIIVIVVVFVLLAIVDICTGVALFASSIWLAFVTLIVWTGCREQGGVRKYLINRVGDVVGNHFVEFHPADVPPRDIHFSFQLFGRYIIQKSIPVNNIETVEWSTGQLTAMVGYDAHDWHISIWFDHHDPRKSEHEKKLRLPKPDQDIYCVGTSADKAKIEALGLSLVAFLRDAGADLVQSDRATRFVKRRDAGEVNSVRPGDSPNSGVI